MAFQAIALQVFIWVLFQVSIKAALRLSLEEFARLLSFYYFALESKITLISRAWGLNAAQVFRVRRRQLKSVIIRFNGGRGILEWTYIRSGNTG